LAKDHPVGAQATPPPELEDHPTALHDFMKGWSIVAYGTALYLPSTVPVTRSRYRGERIPTPWIALA